MNALDTLLEQIKPQLIPAIATYKQLINQRHTALFTDFLPRGYLQTTLSSTPQAFVEELIIAKVHLGILITLCDDFADNPKFFNLPLVKALSYVPFFENLIDYHVFNQQEISCINLAKKLAHQFLERIKKLPHYHQLKNLLVFDLQQFYNCNYYCALLTNYPELSNLTEFRSYAPYNMGIIIIGMCDLMASPAFDLKELSTAREFFYLAQRFGNICNALNTLEREITENDMTNEIVLMGLKEKIIDRTHLTNSDPKEIITKLKPCSTNLIQERNRLLTSLHVIAPTLTSFSAPSYIQGLQQLQTLHEPWREFI